MHNEILQKFPAGTVVKNNFKDYDLAKDSEYVYVNTGVNTKGAPCVLLENPFEYDTGVDTNDILEVDSQELFDRKKKKNR